jgi:6-phosphogluconolactonase
MPKRRSCLWGIRVFFLALLSASLAAGRANGAEKPAEKFWVYVGTYTQGASKGIYLFELDVSSGKMKSLGLAAESRNPSFLAIHPSNRFLYTVNEVGDVGPMKAGAVSAFAIDAHTGKLKHLNEASSGGPGPCHLVVDRAGRHVLAANYSGGSVAVLSIRSDGRLGDACAFVQHAGSSIDKARQEAPHAHSINLDPAGRFAFVADLGLDKVFIYRYDAVTGGLTPNDPAFASVAAGAGPRHFAFHPSAMFAYVINEMHSTVTAFNYKAALGSLDQIQTISTLPRGYKGETSTAEVQVHPSGHFLYGSNRGQNSIAVFSIDAQTGKLTLLQNEGTGIKTPRNFGIDPTGTFLLAASQDAGTIVQFRIDKTTGRLTPTGTVVEVPFPVCVKMMARP